MKKLILTQILFLVCLLAHSQTIKTWYDPYTKTKVHEMYTVSNNLKHGIYKEYDEKGYILKEWNYANGKLNGSSKNYFGFALAAVYDNAKCYLGNVFTQSTYINGEVQGAEVMYDYSSCVQRKLKEITWSKGVQVKSISYHDNGTKKEEIVYNGQCTSYYPNGKLESKYTKVNGVPQGICLEYYPNGVIGARTKYKDGMAIDTSFLYHRNSKLKSYSILDGNSIVVKKSEEYAINGNLKLQKNKTDNFKLDVIEYDTVSQIKTAGYTEKYDNNERKFVKIGKYEVYEKGKLRASRQYDSDGNLNGPFRVYDIKGDTVVRANLKNGNFYGRCVFLYDENWEYPKDSDSTTYFRIAECEYGTYDTKDYYIDKTLQWEGSLIGMSPDIIHGYSIYYYPNGQKMGEGNHKNGKKVGEWKIYKEDGSLEKTENY